MSANNREIGLVEVTEERTVTIRRHPEFHDGHEPLTLEEAKVAVVDFFTGNGTFIPESVDVKDVTPAGDRWKARVVLVHRPWPVVGEVSR